MKSEHESAGPEVHPREEEEERPQELEGQGRRGEASAEHGLPGHPKPQGMVVHEPVSRVGEQTRAQGLIMNPNITMGKFMTECNAGKKNETCFSPRMSSLV